MLIDCASPRYLIASLFGLSKAGVVDSKYLSYFRGQVANLDGELGKVLGGGNSIPAKDRVIGVEKSSANAIILNFASDGLSLNTKIDIENKIHKAFHTDFPEQKLSVNFKRLIKPASNRNLDMPSSYAAQKKSAFGLNIERRAIPGVKSVIGVASGKGGVGKSTIASNLSAFLAKKGLKVGLLDADIYGPSVPTMFGLRGPLPISNENKIVPLESHGVKCVSFGFMSDAKNPVIWRGPLVAKAIEQFLYDVDWGELDFLVIDLPPGTGDVQMSLIENVPIHGTFVVTTPQEVSLIDAEKAISMFEKLDIPVLGVIENMSFFICNSCDTKHRIFGEGGVKRLCDQRKIPLILELPLNPQIGASGDSGEPEVLRNVILSKNFESLAATLGA